MNSTRLFFCFLLSFLAFGPPAHAETLQIAGDNGYPAVIRSSDGKADGVFIRLLARLEAMTGDKYELKLMPWSRGFEAATRGEMGIIGMSYTQERSKTFDYSTDIYDDDIQIITLKTKTFPFSKLDDLKGKVIGGLNGASYGDEVDRAIASGLFTVQRDTSQVGRLGKLLAGRVHGVFISNGQVGFEAVLAGDPDIKNRRDEFAILPHPLVKDPLHLAFAKTMNKREALARFDEAIKKLKKSGEIKTIVTSSFR